MITTPEALAGPSGWLELVAGVAEVAFAKREDLAGGDGEHQDPFCAPGVVEAAVAHLVLPLPGPLRGPRLGEAVERGGVGDLDRVSFDHDVKPRVPVVSPGQQDHVRVAPEVDRLLLGGAGAEVDGAVGPHGHERGDVRPAVCPDRGDPEQLGILERLAGLVPAGGDRIRIAESLVQAGHWGGHRSTSFRSLAGHACRAAGMTRPGPAYSDGRMRPQSSVPREGGLSGIAAQVGNELVAGA